jgi:hypothetical protein
MSMNHQELKCSQLIWSDISSCIAMYTGNTWLQGSGPWHGMDYCHENSTIYMATYNSINSVRTLRTVNLSTDATTEVAEMARSAGGFAIASPPLGIEESATAVEPTVAELEVTDLTGRVVYRAESDQLLRGEHSYLFTAPVCGVCTAHLTAGSTATATRLVNVR